ncbi:hypothetical protein [Thioclava kandeliae]|uniref:Type I secretion protein n=1 Tax=Thioclava kandeliae TaxID=3070818 RepID=A0ABV1SLA1_9RHOB
MDILLLSLVASGLALSIAGTMGRSDHEVSSGEDSPLGEDTQSQPNGENEAIIVLGSATGKFVPTDLFGANIIFSANTNEGAPTSNFESAVDATDMQSLRYPSGEGDGTAETEGVDWINITALDENPNGLELRKELTSVLDWARDPSGDGNTDDAITLTLVIPTLHISEDELDRYAEDVQTFTQLVLESYPDVVNAFEIGNEYWRHTDEETYGKAANVAIKALAAGMQDAGIDSYDGPDIFVQMGNTYNQSSFSTTLDDRGYFARLTDANKTIIAQLDDEARSLIDGVVEHYYWKQDTTDFKNNESERMFIEHQYQFWDELCEQDLSLNITEWNVDMTNLEQNGMAAASLLIKLVENMTDMGVDSAFVWPLQHNTANDLAGGTDETADSNDEDVLTNSVSGAIFDLMAQELPGAELLDLVIANEVTGLEITAYQTDGATVIYVSSRSIDILTFELDLRELVDADAIGTAVTIGIDQSTSDGYYYSAKEGRLQADYIFIDGTPYFYDEHDVAAKITYADLSGPEILLTLKPYEVVQLIFA